MAFNKTQLKNLILNNLPDNSSGLITPENNRALVNEIVDSIFGGITSISELKNYSTAELNNNDKIQVLGYYNSGDGGGGTFFWDSNSTETPNDGTIIQPNGVTTGRWKRELNDIISVKYFGAKGDGITDDTTAIQAACDYGNANGGLVITIPKSSGEYIFTEINVKSNNEFRGDGGVLKYKDNTAIDAGTLYYLIHNLDSNNTKFINLIIDGNKENNPSYLVADSITAVGDGTVVRDCKINNTVDSGIMFSDVNGGQCINNIIVNGGDVGIYYNSGDVSQNGEDNVISGNYISGFTYGGIGIKRVARNSVISNNTIVNCGNGITCEDFGSGSNPSELIITSNSIKNIGYPYRAAVPVPAETGIILQKVFNATVSNNKLQNVSGDVIGLSGCTYSSISNNFIQGYNTDPKTAGDGSNGIKLVFRDDTNSSFNIISGNIIKDVNLRSIFIKSGTFNPTKNIITNNNVSGANVGITIEAGCEENIITSNIFNGTVADEAITANNNMYKDNYFVNGIDMGKFGYRRFTGFADPNTIISPRYPGEMIYTTPGGGGWWKSNGITNTDWEKLNN